MRLKLDPIFQDEKARELRAEDLVDADLGGYYRVGFPKSLSVYNAETVEVRATTAALAVTNAFPRLGITDNEFSSSPRLRERVSETPAKAHVGDLVRVEPMRPGGSSFGIFYWFSLLDSPSGRDQMLLPLLRRITTIFDPPDSIAGRRGELLYRDLRKVLTDAELDVHTRDAAMWTARHLASGSTLHPELARLYKSERPRPKF